MRRGARTRRRTSGSHRAPRGRTSRGRTPRHVPHDHPDHPDPLSPLSPLGTSGPHGAPHRTPGEDEPSVDRVGEVVRWAAFGCVLVLLVPLACGSSPGGAAGAAVGLAAVTAACHALLRRCERTAARSAAGRAAPHRGRRSRTGTGAHRGVRKQR
ncbi:MAG TPA: hypothetical protein VFY14_07635 [Streptomyces sp.]|nr:hypothetical protein [Streptomyces sp.]